MSLVLGWDIRPGNGPGCGIMRSILPSDVPSSQIQVPTTPLTKQPRKTFVLRGCFSFYGIYAYLGEHLPDEIWHMSTAWAKYAARVVDLTLASLLILLRCRRMLLFL